MTRKKKKKRTTMERLREVVKLRGDIELRPASCTDARPGREHVELWNKPRRKLALYCARPATLLRLVNHAKIRAQYPAEVRKRLKEIALEGRKVDKRAKRAKV